VLQGITFVSILALEAVRGKTFLPKVAP
jgi:hypothetical protein